MHMQVVFRLLHKLCVQEDVLLKKFAFQLFWRIILFEPQELEVTPNMFYLFYRPGRSLENIFLLGIFITHLSQLAISARIVRFVAYFQLAGIIWLLVS